MNTAIRLIEAPGCLRATVDTTSPAEIDRMLTAAVTAQRAWSAVAPAERAARLGALAGLLRAESDRHARLITTEMGKPVSEAAAEIEMCARACDYYLEHGPAALADRQVPASAGQARVRYEPVGAVLAVLPWSFPFWQVVRFAVPALLAGNAGIVKHAANVSRCALAVEELFARAGFPRNLLRSLVVDEAVVDAVVDGLIADPRIAAVTVTGSPRAGAAVAASAGRALKKSVLELGGSDPFVVLADADIAAVTAPNGPAVRSRFGNGGQSCLGAKRFIVEQPVAEQFERRLTASVAGLRLGDPLDPVTEIGPLARADLLDVLDRQIRESVAMGARVLTGGARSSRPGAYYLPTVLAGVTAEMPVFTEETLGPVAAVVRARDADHAVELADDSPYGLGASIWTADPERALRLGGRISSGSLFVNAAASSDPGLPFGGTRASGYGRELSVEGLREFTNVRTVVVGACRREP